ncbi:hypothetical protein [Marinomonas sp. PE14-40]|uniref:hypothetical protein n=1 Tax=Marinomonas sp. PE14-40 TaxID=3060621 RepID=UPI003F669D9E
MVRPIGPVRLDCQDYNWEKKMNFKSDALYRVPDKCPKCGSKKVGMKKDAKLKRVLSECIDKVSKIIAS